MSKRLNRSQKKRWTLFNNKREKSTYTKIPKELSTSSSHDYVLTNQEEMDILSRYILDYKNIETGGQLFGYWTFDGKPVVLFVLGPGPMAGHHSAFFMQDLDYLRKCARILKEKYGLDHVGEWHSHHQLGLDHPSGHDARNLSTNIRRLGYEKFLLCIGTCTDSYSSINAFMFYQNKDDYDQIPWLIKNVESPFRKMIEEAGNSIFIYPLTSTSNMKNVYEVHHSSHVSKVKYGHSYWLNEANSRAILKQIVDYLDSIPSQKCIPTLDNNNEIHLVTCHESEPLADIHFPLHFPIDPPIIRTPEGRKINNDNIWRFDGNIYEAFILYYKSFNLK